MKWFKGITLGMLLCIVLSSCERFNEYFPPYILYHADQFNLQDIPGVKLFIIDIAIKWNLVIYESNPQDLKYLNEGRDAFWIDLIDGDDNIFSIISWRGYNEYNSLRFSFFDFGNEKFPVAELDRFAQEVKHGLETRFDLEFYELDPETSMKKIDTKKDKI